MYQPTGNSIRDYLIRVPLEKLEHFLDTSPDTFMPEEYELAKEILRLRKLECSLREQYPRHLLEQWDTHRQRQLLYTALQHDPLWVYEEIVRDILDIWSLSLESMPVELTPKERQRLHSLWEKSAH